MLLNLLKDAYKYFPDYAEIVDLASFLFIMKKHLPWMGMVPLSKNNY